MAFLKNIPSTQTDEELVAAYRSSGNMELAAQLYQRYMELVYGVCLKYLRQPEDAQDSTLIIFEEICTKLHQHEVTHFRAWLHTLAKNHCLMKLRKEKKNPVIDGDPALMQSADNVHLNSVLEKEEHFRQLEYCLGQLAAEQRRSIELFYLEGKCYNEIAGITGMEWNKVRSYIQNGRRNLKICMEKQKATTTL